MSFDKPEQTENSCSFVNILMPGHVKLQHFRLLLQICRVSNPAMQKALEDVLVHGVTRKAACMYWKVAQSHFSVKYRHIQLINQTVISMLPYMSEN
jgi:hypothetical protein